MLNQVKQRKQSGFTLIEVMIVLAIAALILLVVLLAVPALQRSARNNALSTSVNNILSAVNTYESNNNGILPTTASLSASTGAVRLTGGTGATTSPETASTSVNTVTKIVIDDGSSPISKAKAVGYVEVVTGANADCNASANGLSGNAVSARSVVALYVAESGNGNILKCVNG